MKKHLPLLLAGTLGAHGAGAAIVVHLDRPVRTIDRHQLFGQNVALWYSNALLRDETLVERFRQAGVGGIRIPGGSWSDQHFWNGNGVRNGNDVDASKYRNYEWNVDFSAWAPGFNAQFEPGRPDEPKIVGNGSSNVRDLHEFVRRVGCGTMAVANAGTGNAELAKEWVRWANEKQGYDVEYWEIGNELEGGWEAGHVRPDGTEMTGETYAGIFDEFARAMRSVDPDVKIGGPAGGSPEGGARMLKGFLEYAKEPIDFVSCHIYARNRSHTLEEWAQSAEKVFGEARKLRDVLREYRPDRADRIELHLTEFNVWPRDVPTVTMACGIWTSISLGELLRSEIDHCYFWDALTVDSDTGQGHGFLYPTRDGNVIRKSQYWAFYLFNHYFGDRILEVEDDDPLLRSYAALDDDGRLFVVVVNPSSTRIGEADVRLSGTRSNRYASIQSATFSATEYKWDLKTDRPLWSTPPRERTLAAADVKNHRFPPASVTAFVFSEKREKPFIEMAGQTPFALPKGARYDLRVRVADAAGRPVANVPVVVRAKGRLLVPAKRAFRTDRHGVANVSVLTSAKKTGTDVLRLAAKLSDGTVIETEREVRVVEPNIEMICPDAVERGATFPVSFVLHAGTNPCGARITLDAPVEMLLRGGGEELRLAFEEGFASATRTAPNRIGKLTLSAGIPRYRANARRIIEVYAPKPKTLALLSFESQRALKALGGGTKQRCRIDDSVRPNQGVLSCNVRGKISLALSMEHLPNAPRFVKVRDRVVGFSIAAHAPKSTKLSGKASIRWSIGSAGKNYRTATPIGKLRDGKWHTLRIDLPKERMEDFAKIGNLWLTIDGVDGTIHLDDLAVIYKDKE